ncbi:MAG TPA: ABC transporter ATP-binding protein [Chitinispirillaceae bacterium]|nr:ABC transporter ATP-binding protein [Chitinispirillaceae bacterium]
MIIENKGANVVETVGIHVSFENGEVLGGVSLTVKKNERWAIIGPNGAGKSTLIKVIAGLIHQKRGEVLLNGMSLRLYKPRLRAQAMAYVPQKPDGSIPYSVYDFVLLGRYVSTGLMGQPQSRDRELVENALTVCDVKHLINRTMNTLSGGELQRVLLAGAVAQASPLLLLDEPTTFLDPAHERLFFDALQRLHNTTDLTTIMITHDINSAIYQCSHIAALRNGKLVYAGMTDAFKEKCPHILEEVFGIRFRQFNCDQKNETVFGSWGGGL